MKSLTILTLFVSAFLLTGCPGGSSGGGGYLSDLERVQSNHMDFPSPRTRYFDGVRYKLSDIFYSHYNNDYVISDDYELAANNQLNIYFSIESFSFDDAEEFKFGFENIDDLSLLDAVHDHYAIRRNSTLEEATVSAKKSVPKEVAFPGVMQVITGSTYSHSPINSYFFATLELEDRILVIQLIGGEESMQYFYDDFIEILTSISS